MPKKVKSRFGSPFIPEDSAPLTTSFSPYVLRGVVRGLLHQLCLQRKGKGLSVQWVEKAEERIISCASGNMAYMTLRNGKIFTDKQESQFVEFIRVEIQRCLSEVVQHTFFTLNKDSGLILWSLTRDENLSQARAYDPLPYSRPYDEVDRPEQRATWLSKEVPDILEELHRHTPCLHPPCVRRPKRPATPPQILLRQWASSQHASGLRNNLLGHFHSLTPARVRRILHLYPEGYSPLPTG